MAVMFILTILLPIHGAFFLSVRRDRIRIARIARAWNQSRRRYR